jgi:tetratricopeptide (TPR) repeat protein
MAFEYRQQFHKDVVIDMICYRRHGHNEGDDPSYTQPLMYKAIAERRSVRKLYVETLVRRGDITVEEAEQALHEAYKLGLVAAPLLQQLGGALIKTGQWQRAEGALLRSLGTAESPLARKLLGDALVEQQRHEEALAAYMAASAQGMDCKSQAALCKSRLNR